MAKTLHFQSTQIGDGVVSIAPDAQPQTPAAVLTGLYRETAGLDVSSANLLYAVEITVYWQRATPEALTIAVQTAQRLVHKTGDFVVREDGVVVLRGVNWTLTQATKPAVPSGFGGRFVREWVVRFEGTTALRSS